MYRALCRRVFLAALVTTLCGETLTHAQPGPAAPAPAQRPVPVPDGYEPAAPGFGLEDTTWQYTYRYGGTRPSVRVAMTLKGDRTAQITWGHKVEQGTWEYIGGDIVAIRSQVALNNGRGPARERYEEYSISAEGIRGVRGWWGSDSRQDKVMLRSFPAWELVAGSIRRTGRAASSNTNVAGPDNGSKPVDNKMPYDSNLFAKEQALVKQKLLEADFTRARLNEKLRKAGLDVSAMKPNGHTAPPGKFLGAAIGYVGGKPQQVDLFSIGQGHALRGDAANAFLAMQAAAAKALPGFDRFRVSESFRTYEQQKIFFEKARNGGSKAARPGYSHHQMGIALDLHDLRDPHSPVYRWLVENAGQFGFSHAEGSRASERHHWVYVGDN